MMSQLEFEDRVRAWQGFSRARRIAYGAYLVIGVVCFFPFLFGVLQRWLLRFCEAGTALSLTLVEVCLMAALPPFLSLLWQTRRGLACSSCGCTREYIRGVMQDGRCPSCGRQVLHQEA